MTLCCRLIGLSSQPAALHTSKPKAQAGGSALLMEAGRVELARLLQALPVLHTQGSTAKDDPTRAPQFPKGAVHMYGGQAERVLDLRLGKGQPALSSSARPTALMRTRNTRRTWAIRAWAGWRLIPVIPLRKIAALTSVAPSEVQALEVRDLAGNTEGQDLPPAPGRGVYLASAHDARALS
jgi:hypothetical protein